MLAPDSRGPVGLPRMEIHLNLWREMSKDDLGRNTNQNRGPTMSKYHKGCDMECKGEYQAFLLELIDLIIELLGLSIK